MLPIPISRPFTNLPASPNHIPSQHDHASRQFQLFAAGVSTPCISSRYHKDKGVYCLCLVFFQLCSCASTAPSYPEPPSHTFGSVDQSDPFTPSLSESKPRKRNQREKKILHPVHTINVPDPQVLLPAHSSKAMPLSTVQPPTGAPGRYPNSATT
jgi:hypothetical protein